jgi:DNA-binding NarL/FixJ family response regulator
LAGETSSMKILIVDDHALIREALGGVLRELRPDVEIIEASIGRDAMLLAEANADDLDLILLDLGLPDGDGVETLRELRARYPAVAIVVLSASKDRDSVINVLDLGALGFIPKSATRAVMISALQLVFAGGIYVPPEILQHPREALPSGQASDPPSPSALGLTDRQLEVLALMMQGMSNKAICREYDLAEATVKNHVTAILKALKVSNRTEAVIAVAELGWKLPTLRR